MIIHGLTYYYRKKVGPKANDLFIANPFKIDFAIRSQDFSVFKELLKIHSTLFYSSNDQELIMNLAILGVIGRYFEIVLGKKTFFKMYLLTYIMSALSFVPGIFKNNKINLNNNYNKYSSTFALSLCSTYYFISFLGFTSIKIGCLLFYIYLIYQDTFYDVTVGFLSGVFLSILLKRKFVF